MNAQPDNRALMVAFQRHSAGMHSALVDELEAVAQLGAARMRAGAPKFRSELTNSILVDVPNETTREVRPGVAYAAAVEGGRQPGKGLPRFFDPASKSIVDWLEAQAFAGTRKPRKASAAFTARELELRDRYQGLAWHVRHKGLKAHPFVQPVADELASLFPQRMARRAEAVLGAGGTA